MNASAAASIPLMGGGAIPRVGLGTWPLNDSEVRETILTAAEIGYRHIDTAVRYGNEAGVGAGVRDSGIPRSEFFLTTKLDGPFQGGHRAISGLDAALDRLQTDYVDLLLIHWPLPAQDRYVDTWRTFERIWDAGAGRARAIGVSNFKVAHLERLARETSVTPAVNQVQLDPIIARDDQRAYHRRHGIVTAAYSPLGGRWNPVLQHPAVLAIARAHGATAAQVVLAWHFAEGHVVVPKSANPDRLRENLASGSITLTTDDRAALAAIADPSISNDSDEIGH